MSYRESAYMALLATDLTSQASHQATGIPLNLAVLPSLAISEINLFRQRRPSPHPHIHLLRLAVAGQRFKPVEVGAIHQLWRSEGKEGYELCRDLPAEVVGLARVICL